MASSSDVLRLPCVVRGYHVYKAMWDPYLGDDFSTMHQRNNRTTSTQSLCWSLHGLLPRLPRLKCRSDVLVYTNALDIAGEGGRQAWPKIFAKLNGTYY